VAVLLCSRNGERFLAEQIDSICAQTFTDWKIWASDDCSTDSTRDIFDWYGSKCEEKLSLLCGPGLGFVANFLSLVCNDKIDAKYYAFSDQDDIWEPEKLARAVNWLETVSCQEPALYCSRTRLIDEDGHEIGLSPLFVKPPGFANSLTQNIGGGNTMVFNHAARNLLQQAGGLLDVVSHDWWAYIVVAGCGGRIYYDPLPSLRYRQHNTNLVGCNIGWEAKLVRLRLLWQGQFKEWNNRNLKALQGIQHLLTPQNRLILRHWEDLRQHGIFSRLVSLIRSGIYRQTLPGNLGLLFAVLFKRL